VDGQPDQQPDGVDDDMALAPLDLLAGIIAANTAGTVKLKLRPILVLTSGCRKLPRF
jgi:hypothetical protein